MLSGGENETTVGQLGAGRNWRLTERNIEEVTGGGGAINSCIVTPVSTDVKVRRGHFRRFNRNLFCTKQLHETGGVCAKQCEETKAVVTTLYPFMR
jgi:hypothetical protein